MKMKQLAAVLAMMVVLLSGCASKDEKQLVTNKFVKTETVTESSKNEKLVFNGTIKEKSLTTLSFRVGGPIVEFKVKEGDFVNEGDMIAKIDTRDYNTQLETAKAQFLQVKGEYERYKELYANEKIPANTYEKIESGFKLAKANYEHAQNQLNDTELRSPVSGYVYEKFSENHQTTGPGRPIVSIIDKSAFEVVISVPENQIFKVKESKANYLKVSNANISDLPVSLLSISEKAGRDGLYKVKFSLKNRKGLFISPGMSAEVTMQLAGKNQLTTIPSSAVFQKGDKSCVWIYDSRSHQVKAKEVTLDGFAANGKIEVTSGLNVGDTIITAGVHYIVEGEKVEPIAQRSETNIGGLL